MGILRNLFWGLALCLMGGVLGAMIAFLLGSLVLTVGDVLFDLDTAGQGLLMIFVILPGGFALGVVAALAILWTGRGGKGAP